MDEQSVIHVNSGDRISVDPEQNWVIKVNNELTKLPQTRSAESKRWEKQSIYRIPHNMKELCPNAYQPQTVSIGPYHHGKQELEAWEGHKHRSFLTFLHRSKKPLEHYLEAVAPVVEDLKDAYDELEPKWEQDNEAFLQLMIVDGCFVLEIMRLATTFNKKALRQMGYARNDPVFSFEGLFALEGDVMLDMMKLENQLPLLLLVKLLIAEDSSLGVDYLLKKRQLIRLILKFFACNVNEDNIQEYEPCPHILDMYRKNLLLRLPFKKERVSKSRLPDHDRIFKTREFYTLSARKLSESGIRFERSKTQNLNDISFHKGVLKMPQLYANNMLERNYLNMMAFEKFHLDGGFDVRSYVFFMRVIINNAKDVSLLASSGIMFNMLGSDEAVASLFIMLSRDACMLAGSNFELVLFQMLDYCRSPLPRWMAYAKRNYFTNPWVSLSVIAALFLFAFTGFQTVYTVLSYYGPKKEN